MTPADIAASADFRAGLARRLAEVGLVPPAAGATPGLTPLPDAQAAPGDDERKAA